MSGGCFRRGTKWLETIQTQARPREGGGSAKKRSMTQEKGPRGRIGKRRGTKRMGVERKSSPTTQEEKQDRQKCGARGGGGETRRVSPARKGCFRTREINRGKETQRKIVSGRRTCDKWTSPPVARSKEPPRYQN